MYAASAIAATVVLRSALACAFPLFSTSMFEGLGDRWAMSVFAFLSLACMPLPLLFYVSWIPRPLVLVLNYFRLEIRRFHPREIELRYQERT